MSWDNHSLLARSTITNAPGTAGTTFTIADIGRFAINQYITYYDPTSSDINISTAEVGRITAISGSNATVTRVAQGTTNLNVQANFIVINSITPAILQEIQNRIDGSGDVVGPASATDNAIARFDTTTGKLIQNSGVTIDDTGNILIADTHALQLGSDLQIKTNETAFGTPTLLLQAITNPNTAGLVIDIPGSLGIATSTNTDGTGSGKPSLSMVATGETTFENETQGSAGSRYLLIKMTDGLKLQTNGVSSIAQLKSDNLTADRVLQVPDVSGNIVAGLNTSKITVDSTQPSSPSNGDIWVDTSSTGDIATLDGLETLSNKTLIIPTIADFTNAQHNHTNAAGGGQLGTNALASHAITQNLSTIVGTNSNTAGTPSDISLSTSSWVDMTDFTQTITVSQGSDILVSYHGMFTANATVDLVFRLMMGATFIGSVYDSFSGGGKNSSGHWLITNVTAGTYTIKMQAIGTVGTPTLHIYPHKSFSVQEIKK